MRKPRLLLLMLGVVLIAATDGRLPLPSNQFIWRSLVYVPSRILPLADLHR